MAEPVIIEAAINGTTTKDDNEDKDLALRLVLSPFKTTDVDALKKLHLGFALTYGRRDGDVGGENFETAVDTDYFELVDGVEADGHLLRVGGELAYYLGPFSVRSELMALQQEDLSLAGAEEDLDLFGWYVTLTYLITGEDATNKRLKVENPLNPLADEWGTGAFEVAVQVSQVSIDDDIIDAGFAGGTDEALAFTFGLNWYLDDFVLMRFNYLRTEFDDDIGFGDNEDAFLMRLQIEF